MRQNFLHGHAKKKTRHPRREGPDQTPRRRGGDSLLDKLRPNTLPIVRAKVAARDCALGDSFNVYASGRLRKLARARRLSDVSDRRSNRLTNRLTRGFRQAV